MVSLVNWFGFISLHSPHLHEVPFHAGYHFWKKERVSSLSVILTVLVWFSVRSTWSPASGKTSWWPGSTSSPAEQRRLTCSLGKPELRIRTEIYRIRIWTLIRKKNRCSSHHPEKLTSDPIFFFTDSTFRNLNPLFSESESEPLKKTGFRFSQTTRTFKNRIRIQLKYSGVILVFRQDSDPALQKIMIMDQSF